MCLTSSRQLKLCKSAFLPICHMLFLDGVYIETKYGKTRFQRTNAPKQQELVELVHRISHRVAGFLEREGMLERDEDDCMDAGGRAKQEPEPKTVT